MAKAKKQEKPIEQRLEEALVLYEKTPYELPKNWCWVKFKSIADFGMGQTILSKELKQEGVPIYSASADGEIFGYINSKDNRIKLSEGDFVIAARGTIGSIKFISAKEACCTQTTMYMKPYNKEISKYLYYAMRAFSEKIFVATGATIPQLTISSLDDKMIPLAPFEEQKRIVEIIEKQFAKLDEARDLIQKSLDSFADRKFAILHKAFTGELTKQWRENNGRAFSFKRKTFDEVAKIKSNLVEPSEYLDMPHIAPDCIEKFTGKLIGYKTIREDGVFSPKHRCYKNQILYSKIRPNLSKLIIAEFDCLCSADMYPIEANENVKYLFYAMLSSEFLEQASNAGSRSVLPKINQKELSRLFIDIPNIDEQEEIVRILDSIFEKEDKSKELLDMLDTIDEMKKSILARAFRGELGTSNPTDEPTTDLLKKFWNKIIKEKIWQTQRKN